MSDSVVTRHEMVSALVPSPATYTLVQPQSVSAGAPVLLWLHGGDGPAAFTQVTQPAFDACWADGSLPPMSVVIPHSHHALWADGVGELAAWESMLIDELLPHVRAEHGIGSVAAVGGISMGGMGALRAAFRRPARFSAVLGIEPAIEPTAHWPEVSTRDRAYRTTVLAEVFGDPVDQQRFLDHHPIELARRHGPAIASSGLAVYLECGDEDMLDLHQGAESLHRAMWDIGLRHEYRSVRGADHVGRSLVPRTVDALRFLGRSLVGDEPDERADAAAASVRRAHHSTGFRTQTTVVGPAGPIDVWEYGDGEPVVMLPSLGRGAADFDDLALRLARAGYHAIHPEPRGIGGSTGDLSGLTMADLAADAAAVVHAVAGGPVTLVGHAFGNRIARMTATEYPHLVDSVVLLCCGGLVQPAPEHAAALHQVFDPEASDAAHHEAVSTAFFAPGNDASVWFDGWHGIVAAFQGAATANQPVDHWWGAGGKDLLVVQPAQDVMAVPENALRICEEFGDRASMVTVENAGHALLPEQPAAVEVAVRSWLTRNR